MTALTRRRLSALALSAALILAGGLVPASSLAQSGEPQPILEQEPLTVETASGPVDFTVEIARTAREQSMGLMFRELVPAGTGMLFVHPVPRVVTMWMRNTPTSLDMLFIDEAGVIRTIAARTTPFSTDIVGSDGPVTGVLEIRGGEAERLGIEEGDRVLHPHFGHP